MWTHWHTEPLLIGSLLFLIWAYALATGPLRERIAPGMPFPTWRASCFYAGIVLLYITVASPLDLIAEVYLVSAHMAQHILIIYPVAMLLVLGLPPRIVSALLRRSCFRRPLHALTRPVPCGVLFIGVLTAWHVPFFYEWALHNRTVHNLEHFTMLAVSLLLWWAIFSKSPEVPALSYGKQILLVFAVSLGKIPVGTYLTFSGDILYPTYELAPRITALSAMEDQILAGAMMTLLAKFAGILIMGWSFYHWYLDTERESNESLIADAAEIKRFPMVPSRR